MSRQAARAAILQVDLDAERTRKEIANLISPEALQAELYARSLPAANSLLMLLSALHEKLSEKEP